MTSPSLRLASGGRGPARRTPCGWPCLLPGHVFGRPLDRLDDVVIAGAPAEVAFQLVADLLLGGARIALEELGGRQDHARRAEAALQAMLLPEALLDRMEIAVLGEPFDGRDRRAVRLHREERARLHRLPVHEDGARAALARIAAHVRAGETHGLADVVNEQEPGLDLVTVRLAVDGHLDWQFHHSTSGIRAVCCGAPAQERAPGP